MVMGGTVHTAAREPLPDTPETMSLPRAQRPSPSGIPPEPAPGFCWRRASWGWQLQAAALSAIARHGWSARPLNPGQSDDDAGWTEVAGALGVLAARLHRLRQVHGASVHHAEGDRPAQRPEADIVVTGPGGTAIAVQVADCVPLLLADARTGAVAAAHAGWRGTAADVAGKTVRALGLRFDARPEDLVAAVGPSIGPCCYKVGAELVAAFTAAGWGAEVPLWFSPRGDQQVLDLWRANRDQLERAGVPASRIALSGLCTGCHPGWFDSYRRDGPGTGRTAGYIRGMTNDERR